MTKTYAVATEQLRTMRIKAAQMNTTINYLDGVCIRSRGNWGVRNTLDGPQPTWVVRWTLNGTGTSWPKIVERFGNRQEKS